MKIRNEYTGQIYNQNVGSVTEKEFYRVMPLKGENKIFFFFTE